ncbi:MAG: restriction endonuclease subunit S [Bacteroidetes bacterium]|nr:restriction endonuclease subunit S [Bacteroidota bacterium]
MKNWELKYLDDVCELITCGVAARPNYVDEGVPFLSAKNVKDGQIIWSGYNCITEETHKELTKNNKPLKGDLLYTRVGSYGEAAVIEDDYEFSVFVSLTLIKVDKSKLNNYYLKHYLNSEAVKNLAKASISGSGVGNLNVGTVRKFTIPLPPLPEQQRIVSILDEAFAAIAKAKANAEQNLKNAKELFESYLQGVFENKGDGWEEKTLGQLCVFTQGIQRDVKLQSETEGENQVRFLRIVDYTQGNEPPRYIDFPGEKYILNTDDVALVRYGASTGFVCRGLEGALANNLFRVIPKSLEKLTNDFLFIYLQSPIFQNVIKATMNGAAMPAISFGLIEEIPFPLPPLKEQQTIVRQLDALRAETQKLEAVYQKKIDDLEELKKSILQKAFAGELRSPEGAEYKSEVATPLADKKPNTITSPEGV